MTKSFGEKEIVAILRRASELQRRADGESEFGLAPEELARVGSSAGIQAEYVATAILETDVVVGDEPINLWGGPMSLTLDVPVPGSINDDTWESMVTEMRGEYLNVGNLSKRSTTRVWSCGRDGRGGPQVVLSVDESGPRSLLSLVWNEPASAIPFYVAALAVALVLIPVVFQSIGMVSASSVGLYLAIVLFTIFAARWVVVRYAQAKKWRLRRVMARLIGVACSSRDFSNEPSVFGDLYAEDPDA